MPLLLSTPLAVSLEVVNLLLSVLRLHFDHLPGAELLPVEYLVAGDGAPAVQVVGPLHGQAVWSDGCEVGQGRRGRN